jgi:hypothetical protein
MSTGRKTDFSSLMHSYSVGCLDLSDKKIMLDYFKTGGDFAWQELGEFQNLAALLPSFLEIEEPNPQIKDKVARKLYRLKEQKKPDRTTQQQISKPEVPKFLDKQKAEEISLPSQIPSFKSTKTDLPIQKVDWDIPEEDAAKQTAVSKEKIDDYKPVRPIQRKVLEPERPQQTQIDAVSSRDQQERSKIPEQEHEDLLSSGPILSNKFEILDDLSFDEVSKQDKPRPELFTSLEIKDESKIDTRDFAPITPVSTSSYETNITPPKVSSPTAQQVVEVPAGASKGLIFILFFLSIISIGVVYYLLNSQIKKSEVKITEALTNSTKSFENVMLSNQQLNEILNSPKFQVAYLDGSNRVPDSFGKLFFDQETKRGILQLSNLPKPGADKIYKIWFNVNGSFIGRDVIYNSSSQYFLIPNIPEIIESSSGAILITEEAAGESVQPSKNIFYTGTYTIR